MCTIIRKTQKYKPRIAKQDMTVYKLGYDYESELDESGEVCVEVFTSGYKGFDYRAGEEVSTTFTYNHSHLVSDSYENHYRTRLEEKNRCYVCGGFHAYASIARSHHTYQGDMTLGEFIVPKGAKYYLNEAENIVSDRIKFVKFLYNVHSNN